MNEQTLMKNLIIKNYHQKNAFFINKCGKRDNDNGNISDQQYLHLKNVWNTFSFDTFRDYRNHT